MATLQNHEPGSMAVPEAIHVCICAPDEELRRWLVDELMLMTWVGALQLDCVASLVDERLRPDQLDVLIVGLDGLEAHDLGVLRARAWTAPVIAIGGRPDPEARFDRALDARFTSRELKEAIRTLVLARRAR